jgi:hypothetical protein
MLPQLSEVFLFENDDRRFQQVLHRLASKHDGSVPLTHETPENEWKQIKNSGRIGFDEIDSVFCTVGHPEKPVWLTKGTPGTVIRIWLPLSQIQYVSPGMWDGDLSDELTKHHDLIGAEVSVNRAIPLKWCETFDALTMKRID